MIDRNVAIKVEGLGKSYLIGHDTERGRYVALRDVIARNARNVWRKTNDLLHGRPVIQGDSFEEVWALKDVNCEIRKGESVGIIGRNGAGKSTFLKVLSRITEPTTGTVQLRGKVASLLEVGTGFHPELSGRENIYLNGAILGMRRQEITRRFDEIVEFSGVDRFLDTPVKRYSSGMYVRLAFSVAAHLEPDTLIVDEVLAVGDVQFQKKCLDKMGDVVSESGRTVLFVSHNMSAIQGLCKRAIWLDGGVVRADGDSASVVQQYLSSVTEQALFSPGRSSGYADIAIERAVLRNSAGEPQTVFRSGEPIAIEVHFNALRRVKRPNFWFSVLSLHGSLFGANMLFDGAAPEFIEGPGRITCTFKDVRLLPLTYSLRMGIRGEDGVSNHIPTTEVASFSISGTSKELGLSDHAANSFDTFYPLLVSYEWQLPDGTTVQV